MDRLYRCTEDGCEAEPFPTLAGWKKHMREEHDITGDDALESLLPDGGGRGKEREQFNERTVAVRLRLKDTLALEDLADKRGVNDSTLLRQLLVEEVDRSKQKPETAEKLCADAESLAQRLAAFSKSGEPKGKGSENVRDEAQRLSASLAKFAKKFKGEKSGGFWEA